MIYYRKSLANQGGQGLLELVIALGILVTGISVVLTLSFANAAAGREAEARAVAANLSREGIEVVQHIRFSNIDLGFNWDQGLSTGTYAVVFDPSSTPSWRLDPVTSANQELLLQESSAAGFLGLRLQGSGSGTPTGFLRTVSIGDICEDGSSSCLPGNPKAGIRVNAAVTWKTGGRRTVSTEATYYHWQ